jgi:chaperonin GroEL (HSP60 family)
MLGIVTFILEKQILFRSDVQEEILHGAIELVETVRATLGPKSKSVLIQKQWRAANAAFRVTNDSNGSIPQ